MVLRLILFQCGTYTLGVDSEELGYRYGGYRIVKVKLTHQTGPHTVGRVEEAPIEFQKRGCIGN
ncbi:hypothetical protein SDC9_183556 [bioreactor metagenome]|uniref:Uncharacterized protein n=1 Tax=bioreactor metagenome TaxID=1076179 RepID=A0A645HAJ4_9ZZZZ